MSHRSEDHELAFWCYIPHISVSMISGFNFEVSSQNYQDLLLVIQGKIQHPTPRGEFSLPSAASKIGLWIAINLYGVKYVGLMSVSFEIYHLFMKTWVCFEMVPTQTSSDSVQQAKKKYDAG